MPQSKYNPKNKPYVTYENGDRINIHKNDCSKLDLPGANATEENLTKYVCHDSYPAAKEHARNRRKEKEDSGGKLSIIDCGFCILNSNNT